MSDNEILSPEQQDEGATALVSEEGSPLQIFGKLSRLSWETAASYSFSMQMGMLVYLLSQLNDDEEHLAAITLITSLLNSLVGIGVSPLLATALVAGKELGELREAQKNGESDELLQLKREHLAAAFGNALILSMVTSPVIIAIMVNAKPLLVHGMNQDEAVAEIASSFIKYYSLAIPAIMVRISADNILFAFEKTRPAMILSLINLSLGMSLGSVLAFGKLGAPKMGATGLLVGCILDPWLTAAEYLIYLAVTPEFKSFPFLQWNKPWHPYWGQLKEMTTYGGSIAANMTVETTLNLVINLYAGIVGVRQQAAFSSIMQFSLFSFLLQIAFGQTAAQEINRKIGASQFELASLAGKMGIASLMAYILPVLITFSVYPQVLSLSASQNGQSLNQILQSLAPIMFAGCAFDALRFTLLQQLRVLGDDQRATAISMGSIVIGIVLSGVLGLKTELNINGVAAGFTFSTGLAACMLLLRWISRIQASSIEKNKAEGIDSVSVARLSFFSSVTINSRAGSEQDVELGVTNPIHSVELAR
ncbi:MAG: hypothetical protein CK426_06340 [Legionella sp.]|nr:MAG: hypothetical protein CK423_02560 [Legionella sp.]PJD98509.1 MAG: hypothetical protein CK426_06340 [Legionella sp.]